MQHPYLWEPKNQEGSDEFAVIYFVQITITMTCYVHFVSSEGRDVSRMLMNTNILQTSFQQVEQ